MLLFVIKHTQDPPKTQTTMAEELALDHDTHYLHVSTPI